MDSELTPQQPMCEAISALQKLIVKMQLFSNNNNWYKIPDSHCDKMKPSTISQSATIDLNMCINLNC